MSHPFPPLPLLLLDPTALPRLQPLLDTLPIVQVTAPPRHGLLLVHTGERLELHLTGEREGPVHAEFVTGAMGHRRQGVGRRQPLGRAVGLKPGEPPPTVLDVTGGLGRDAFILATLGCHVRVVERHPIMAALLADGLRRAREHPTTREAANRISGPRVVDAIALMQSAGEERPMVVYVDPMYPERGKAALVKKEMRRLRMLVGEDADAPALLAAALTHASARVVVKRPRPAPPLPGPPPHFQVDGRTTRFDVYLTTS